jgi:hypothetical protein
MGLRAALYTQNVCRKVLQVDVILHTEILVLEWLV